MKTINQKVFLIVILLTLCLMASTISVMSQDKRISNKELLNWIDADETKTDIKAWIKKRKLDFEAKPDTLSEIKAKWKDVNLEDMPADLEQCIKENAPQPAATLIVECPNTQCQLFMNGESLGEASPGKHFLKPGLPLGTATVLATAKGYKNSQNTITLVPGQNRIRFEMEAPTAKLIVECLNTQCDLSLNGKPLGTAGQGKSLVYSGLKPERITVQAKARGYKDSESTIDLIARDQPNRISFKMKQPLGGINVTCEPVDCDIYLDGVLKGKISQKQHRLSDFPVGDHEIEIRAQGYDNSKMVVSVKEDAVQSVVIKMKAPLPPGVTIEAVKKELWDYFTQEGPVSNISYAATWMVNPVSGSAQPARLKQTVTGLATLWPDGEYTARLIENGAAFNIYGILSQIQSNALKVVGLEGVGAAEAQIEASVASPNLSKEYIKLIAEDGSDYYELTLEKFSPYWVPIIIRQWKKGGGGQNGMVACALTQYGIYSPYTLPTSVRILDQAGKPELEVKLEAVARR